MAISSRLRIKSGLMVGKSCIYSIKESGKSRLFFLVDESILNEKGTDCAGKTETHHLRWRTGTDLSVGEPIAEAFRTGIALKKSMSEDCVSIHLSGQELFRSGNQTR